jgi:hypothetical protein
LIEARRGIEIPERAHPAATFAVVKRITEPEFVSLQLIGSDELPAIVVACRGSNRISQNIFRPQACILLQRALGKRI